MTEPVYSKSQEQVHRLVRWTQRRRSRRHCLTFIIALVGYVLASMPGLGYLGQLAWAILIAAVYRQREVTGETAHRNPIHGQARLIILYGLKLNIGIVFQQGLGLMMRDVISVIFAIALPADCQMAEG